MALPKRKTSRTRRDKRRTHLSIKPAVLASCPNTGLFHLPHQAYYDAKGNMYYRGELVIGKLEKIESQ